MNSNIIEINDLVKKYGKNIVLDIKQFNFKFGNTYLLIGANGAGKSTLIKLIIGLIKESNGKIIVNTKKISYVPERFTFPDALKVYDFLEKLCKVKTKIDMKQKINYLVDWWKIDKNKKLSQLSKGMKQKVLIMQAIILEVDLYIFDEPLNGLDIDSQKDFLLILKHLKKLGKTIIICTHYDKYYSELVSECIYFRGGKINND